MENTVTFSTSEKQVDLENARSERDQWGREMERSPLHTKAAQRVMVIDSDGVILFTNRDYLGLSVDDLLGTRIFDHSPEEDSGQIAQALENIFSQSVSVRFEARIRWPNGDFMRCENYAIPLLGENQVRLAMVWSMDLDEHEQVEKVLRESEEKFRALAEQSPNMIFLHWGGRLVYVNQSWVDVMGYSKQELFDPTFDFMDLIAVEDRARVKRDYEQRINNDLMKPYATTLVNKSGKKIEAIISSRLVNYEGVAAILGIITDISDQKRFERELSRTNALLGAIVRAQTDFIAQENLGDLFARLLQNLLELTQSEYGLIGEIVYSPDGQPYLKTQAITGADWDGKKNARIILKTAQWINPQAPESLIHDVIATGEPVLYANPDPGHHRSGLPSKHPTLSNFLGMPLSRGGELVGVVGLANRSGGFDRDLVAYLKPLVATCGYLIEAFRSNASRLAAEAAIQRRLVFEERISQISSRFVGVFDIDEAISKSLADIGRLSGAGRSYLFQFRPGSGFMDNTHEWCAQGVSPQIHNLENLPLRMYPWSITQIRAGKVVQIEDVSLLPPEAQGEKDSLQSQEIKSCLLMPVKISGEVGGFMGFDNIIEAGSWSKEDLSLLKITSEIIGNALAQRQVELTRQRFAERLLMLHNIERAILQDQSPKSIAKVTLDHIQRLVPCQQGSIAVFDFDKGQALVFANQARQEQLDGTGSLLTLDAYCGLKKLNQGEVQVINDLCDVPHPAGEGFSLQVEGVQSYIRAPLISKGELLGALSLESYHKHAFTDEHARIACEVADSLAIAIQQARLFEKVRQLAVTDDLTGLHNRRHFFELAHHEFGRIKRYGSLLSAIMLDVDQFKGINDTYGHATGDRVLREVAFRLHKNVRKADVLGRYGGDEFVILLPETDLYAAQEMARRLRALVAGESIRTDHGHLQVTISLGVASMSEETQTLAALLESADAALYAAKRIGHDQVMVR